MQGIQISSEQFWVSALVAAALDGALLLLLRRRIDPTDFRGMGWVLVGTAMAFWAGTAFFLVQAFWEDYYRYLFPPAYRSGILLWVPFTYGAIAWILHRLALRSRGQPLLAFCVLAGIESLAEHLWGIFGLRLLEVPALQQASAWSILAFAIPEYILYWCIIIGIAALLYSFGRRLPTAPNL